MEIKFRPRVLIQRKNGATVIEAFQRAKKFDERILSNKEHDLVLVEMCNWRAVYSTYSAWTGTMAAHVSPGVRLGSEITHQDPRSKQIWRFPVPVGFRELKNSILVAEHPDYDLDIKGDTVTVVVPENKLAVVENFAAETKQLYIPDQKFGIPTGSPIHPKLHDNDLRYLKRSDASVGLIARDCGHDAFSDKFIEEIDIEKVGTFTLYGNNHIKQSVYIGCPPSDRLGVLIAGVGVDAEFEDNLHWLAVKLAPDALTELEKLEQHVRSGSIENINELIKILAR